MEVNLILGILFENSLFGTNLGKPGTVTAEVVTKITGKKCVTR